MALTPSQFDLVRRTLISLYSGGNSSELIAVVSGEEFAQLHELRKQEVDFRSRGNIELQLSRAELRAVHGALAFAYLNHSSEEAFHNKYGFYRENVQAVGQAICAALQEL
ncbi:hypothetical protein ACWD01_15685 [Streptomyces sp. NPDC002835]